MIYTLAIKDTALRDFSKFNKNEKNQISYFHTIQTSETI